MQTDLLFPKIAERQYRQYGQECMCADCKGEKRMEDEFDAFKPTYAPKSFFNWNVDRQVRAYAEKKGLPYDEAGIAMVSEKHAAGQFLMPQQIADMALFLARDAAQNITGSSFSLDVGWTAQ